VIVQGIKKGIFKDHDPKKIFRLTEDGNNKLLDDGRPILFMIEPKYVQEFNLTKKQKN